MLVDVAVSGRGFSSVDKDDADDIAHAGGIFGGLAGLGGFDSGSGSDCD